MTEPSLSTSEVAAAVKQSLREHWVIFLIEGIVFIALGVLAILVPQIASLAVTVFLGWLFLFSGVMGLISTFWARQAPGFWWSLLSAVLAIAVGVMLLWSPVAGVLSLTYLLIAFFVIEGI